MDLLEHKAKLEQNMQQIDDKLTMLQAQLTELQMMQQRHIGALQLVDAMIAEREQAEKTEAEG